MTASAHGPRFGAERGASVPAPPLWSASGVALLARRPHRQDVAILPRLLRAAAGVAFLSVLATGCDLLTTQVEPLRSGVEFTLTDGYDLNGTAEGLPAPYLRIATDAQYGCVNYPLEASVQRSGATTTVDLKGVRKGSSCLTATGPALFRTALSLPAGRSTLVIRGAVRDSYAVTVSDSLIEVFPAAGAFSRTSVSRSWRVPQNTFAAQCGPSPRCSAFHDSLSAFSGLTPFVFGSGATPPSPPFGAAGADERVYRYAGEATLSGAVTLMYRLARNDSGFYASLRTWRNEYHASWWPQ